MDHVLLLKLLYVPKVRAPQSIYPKEQYLKTLNCQKGNIVKWRASIPIKERERPEYDEI